MKKRKLFESVCGVISFLGFLLLIGTVGAMEQDTITMGRGFLQSVICMSIFAGAAYIGGFMDEDKIYYTRRAARERPSSVCERKRQSNYQDTRRNRAL